MVKMKPRLPRLTNVGMLGWGVISVTVGGVPYNPQRIFHNLLCMPVPLGWGGAEGTGGGGMGVWSFLLSPHNAQLWKW